MEQYRPEPNIQCGSSSKLRVYTEISTGKKIVIKRTTAEEAAILSEIDHPNVIKCNNSYEDGDKICIVMDYMEQGDLRQYLANNSLTEQQIAKIIYQLLSAVACIHDLNIIHRDIKPENVVVDGDGDVKLWNFELAEKLESPEAFVVKLVELQITKRQTCH